jgi:hypothetical protein
MEKQGLLGEVIAGASNRRSFLNKIAIAGAAVAAIGNSSKGNAQTTTAAPTDADILNFALNLEYLEAEFYTVATTGMTIDQMGIGITGSGTQGAATGGAKVNFGSGAALTAAIANQIAYDERSHVALIRGALTAAGATPIAQPAINLDALGIGFGGVTDFLQLARAFEDIGVSAYAGAAPLITSNTILGYAARIAQTEAEHVANIRLQIAQMGIATTALDGVDVLPPPSGTNYFSVDQNGLTLTRTPGNVLYLAYGNMANATSGGFFPAGANGTINMSSTAATLMATNGTTAVVTPTSLTSSSSQITLDGSGSTSGSGSLTYLFMVLPGGLVPAVLQSPNSSSAIVQFVNGPGIYLLELIVTDGAGNMSTSQTITLTYMP